ncbi:MAG: alpha/beta fold hydrolase [Deltaproteobacteria bacterium]|nr:alpha/beta fold hydrolase [Deltaproteobacteria bacterium]
MDREKLVFTMLKPIDAGIGLSFDVLKKYGLMEPASNLAMQGLRRLMYLQYSKINNLKIEGLNNITKKGGVLFACNHQSWADVQVMGASCSRRLHFIAKDMFKDWPVLRHLIELNGAIYVTRAPRDKNQTQDELGNVVKALKEGKAVGIFPEGTIPGEENIPRHAVEPETGLLKGRTGVVRLALEAGVPIIPVGVSGTGKAFPPEIYPRLELLRLPGNSPMKIRYGKPLCFKNHYGKNLTQTEDGRKTLRALTNQVMKEISKLVDHSMNYIPLEVPVKGPKQHDKIGVLLLHGFTSSLDTVNGLVPHLKKEKIEYEMPVLRGHGTHYQDMVGVTAGDWYHDALKSLNKLAKRVDQVIVVGLSMGGLVALDLGIQQPQKVAGVVTVAAAVKFADPLAGLTPLIAKVIQFWPSPNAFCDMTLAKNSTNYPKFATDAFGSLFAYSKDIQKKLGKLTTPIRIIQSKKDQVIAPLSANIIYENVASQIREICWFEKSGHEMMQDLESEKVFEAIMQFVKKFKKEKVLKTK